MKKTVLLMMIACCLILSACSNAASIGIIGGADGPTAIYVDKGNKKADTEKLPVRMINVDGTLYYDSGLLSDMTPRCGTLDGNLKKTAGEFEIPKNDSEANFETNSYGFGYQNASGITKEIPTDRGWAIFKKIDGERLSRYEYCFKISGRHPNAAKDSEYVILADTTDITFEQITKYFFGSQYEDHQIDIVVVHTDVYDDWGIRMWADDITPKGITIYCEQFGGNPTGELQTGAAYTLEVWEKDKWKPVEYKDAEEVPVWNAIAYSIPKNEVTSWNLNFEFIYDELKTGRYRVGKEIMDFRKAGDYDSRIYYAEFTIE